MSDELYKDLEHLILKQQLGILDLSERRLIKDKLVAYLRLKGYNDVAELICRLHPEKSESEKVYILETINKVFPCSRSKKTKSS